MDPHIADYIRANRKRYTREAINQQLADAGHDPAEVERTWAALDAPDADAVAGEGFWGRFALILVGINIAVWVAVGVLTGMIWHLAAGSWGLAAILAVALGIGALISWGIVASTGPAKMGPTTAIMTGIAIPLLFALFIGGSCVALVGAVGLPPPPATQGSMELSLAQPLDIRQTIPATCQPGGPEPGDGFNVFANHEIEPGRVLDLSIGSYPAGPGGQLNTHVWIGIWPENESETTPPMQWSNETMRGGAGPIDIELSGTGGRLTLEDLPPMNEHPGNEMESLSGEIAWTCE